MLKTQQTVTTEVSIRCGTVFGVGPDGELGVRHHWGAHLVRGAAGDLAERLAKLVGEPAGELDDDVAGFAARFPFLVVHTLLVDGIPQLRLEPIGERARLTEHELTGDTVLRLSRFAYLRGLDDELVLESPLALYRAVLLASGLVEAVAGLVRPRRAEELWQHEHVLRALVDAGLLDVEEPSESLRSWSFHDLLFHTRSRTGRNDQPHGGTFRFGEDAPFPAAVKETTAGIPLFRPDLGEIAAADASFTEVLESRRSVREYGPQGLSVRELGEFLYRTMRVRAHLGGLYEMTSRPYPGGGACYELEAYVVVNRCEGLGQGVYHYDPAGHALSLRHGPGPELRSLYGSYRSSMRAAPDVLLVFTCRFQRLSLKYESIAYGLALRDLGALYQTLYLTATSMGLAACALGDGDSEVADRALGLDFTEESAIGEFVLGSLPAEVAA